MMHSGHIVKVDGVFFRLEAEVLTTEVLEIDFWYKDKENLKMSVKTNLRNTTYHTYTDSLMALME